MERIRQLFIVGAASMCAPVLAQQANIAHFENIDDWTMSARLATDDAQAAALTAQFSAFGKQFELALELNRRVEAMLDGDGVDARAYRGKLRNVPDSWVRLVLASGDISGLIWDGTTLFGIEPGTGSAATMYRADDVLVPAGSMSCAMHEPADNAGMLFAELAGQAPEIAHAAGAGVNLNLGIVSDPELSGLYADPQAAMLIRINNVDGIYSEQLGIQLTVERVDAFDDANNDPFSDTTVAENLLEELSIFRGDTPEQDAQGLTHMFTGRDLDGSTVGVAYIGGVCAQRSPFDPSGRSFGVGLTQANFGPAGAFLESLIAAHEIGHNFGAPHDGEAGDDCAATPASGFIMGATLDPNADDFSQCSIDVITANVPAATCLTAIATVDMTVDGQSNVATPLTETQFSYAVSATNQGLETAMAASVELEFDPALTVLSVTPQSGTCGPAQSTVSCNLGDIPAASTRTVDVVLQSNAPGVVTVNGSVAATDDVDATNDSFADSVTIVAASDLALITNATTLTQDETDTIVVTLENRSGVDASNISLTGTWSSGLDVDSASFAANNCSVAAGALTFDCQITSLAGLSSGALNITLSGTDIGSEVITLNVSAQESDPDAGNNSSNLAVQVIAASTPPPASGPDPQSDPAAQESGGGGGSLGPLGLLALLWAWFRSRRVTLSDKANFS